MKLTFKDKLMNVTIFHQDQSENVASTCRLGVFQITYKRHNYETSKVMESCKKMKLSVDIMFVCDAGLSLNPEKIQLKLEVKIEHLFRSLGRD